MPNALWYTDIIVLKVYNRCKNFRRMHARTPKQDEVNYGHPCVYVAYLLEFIQAGMRYDTIRHVLVMC